MLAQRLFARSAQRLGASPIARNAARRNYSSETGKQFTGAEDNAFNRERAHIKEHAAQSGGE